VTRHAASTQAYSDDDLEEILQNAGFEDIQFHPSLTGKEEDINDFSVISAKKPVETHPRNGSPNQ